jgi:uncharacterized membrane protein
MNKEKTSNIPAVLAYIPLIGWLYVYFLHRQNEFAMFHLRQSVGLVLFLIGSFVLWAVVGWLIAWIPYMAFVSVALFSIVIAAYIFGVIAWVGGIINALNYRATTLPGFGGWAATLPLR